VLADVLPFLGSVVSVGTGIISFLASLLLTCITISIAWIVYRPVVGICLLVVGGGLAYLIRNRLQATKPAQTA
jgi:UDP-N-acetylmuramyl pentapeptide phosphotransferase/UDP-N-acetylglucosamine-1-phosphate transferase